MKLELCSVCNTMKWMFEESDICEVCKRDDANTGEIIQISDKLYQINAFISLNYIALKKTPLATDMQSMNHHFANIIKEIRDLENQNQKLEIELSNWIEHIKTTEDFTPTHIDLDKVFELIRTTKITNKRLNLD